MADDRKKQTQEDRQSSSNPDGSYKGGQQDNANPKSGRQEGEKEKTGNPSWKQPGDDQGRSGQNPGDKAGKIQGSNSDDEDENGN